MQNINQNNQQDNNTQQNNTTVPTNPSLHNPNPTNFDPNNPPEFNPNANKPTVTHKHAISGLGIAIIIVGIVLLGLLVGKAIGLFVQAEPNPATAQNQFNCSTIECCHNYGRCMAVSDVDKYTCQDLQTCVTCNPQTCSYEPVNDRGLCAGKPCGIPSITPTPTGTPTPNPTGGENTCGPASMLDYAKTKARQAGSTGACTCVGNNPFCCYVNNNGETKCLLKGNWGIVVSGKNVTCPEPFTWGPRLEYGKWWCFDTSRTCLPSDYTISGQCAGNQVACTKSIIDSVFSSVPSACFSNPHPNPTPTATINPSPTPTPTTTPTPTNTPTPTPTEPYVLICNSLTFTQDPNINTKYNFTCSVNHYANQCKLIIDDNTTLTATPDANNNCHFTYDLAELPNNTHNITCYAVDTGAQYEQTSDNCKAAINTNNPTNTPSPVPTTGIIDSPIAFASLSVIVIAIGIFEAFTGSLSNSLLKLKKLGKTITSGDSIKIRIKLSKHSKVRKLLEEHIKNKIQNE